MADPKAGVDDLCAGAGHARDIKLASLMHGFGYPYAVQFQGGRILTSKAVINLEIPSKPSEIYVTSDGLWIDPR